MPSCLVLVLSLFMTSDSGLAVLEATSVQEQYTGSAASSATGESIDAAPSEGTGQ